MEEVMDEEIRNAMEVEIKRLTEEEEDIRNAMEVEIRRLTEEEEQQLQKKKDREEEEIRDMRFKFVLHVSPLEIIHNNVGGIDDEEDFIDVVVAENINQIELVIDVIDHYYIYQYWSPPLRILGSTGAADNTTMTTTASSLCQHHDYHHPRDDDDEDMILTSCQPLCVPPKRIKIIIQLDQGVFAAAASDDDHIMTLLGDVDLLFNDQYALHTQEQLEDLKRRISRRISEAKADVLRAKPPPKRLRICVDVSPIAKKYYGSAETATFAAAMDSVEQIACAASLLFNINGH